MNKHTEEDGGYRVPARLQVIGTAGVMTNGTLTPQLNIIIGLGMISACFVDLIGIGLGISGAVDRSSKKVYPVLGIALNVAILVLFGALLAVGLSMKAQSLKIF